MSIEITPEDMDLQEISEEEIYLNELNGTNHWIELVTTYKLSEEIMDKFANKLDW